MTLIDYVKGEVGEHDLPEGIEFWRWHEGIGYPFVLLCEPEPASLVGLLPEPGEVPSAYQVAARKAGPATISVFPRRDLQLSATIKVKIGWHEVERRVVVWRLF